MPVQVSRFDVRTSDPDAAHAELRAAYGEVTIRSFEARDGFRFSHGGVAAGGVTLARVRYGGSLAIDVAVPRARMVVVTRLSGTVAVDAGAGSVRPEPGRPVLLPPYGDWHGRIEDVELHTTTLERAVVDRALRVTHGIGLDRVRFTSMVPQSAPAVRYWRGLLRHVERDVLGNGEVTRHPLALAEATRSLATALLITFPHIMTRGAGDRRDGRDEPAVLRRATAYIDEHADAPIGVVDIADAARIGVRGLQRLFREHRDCTPLDHLRQVRMARAHGDLEAADPSRGDTVASVAARWGFTHPGRFSVQYRLRYGRPPSETLRH